MKTKKVRPVLVESKEPTNILLSGFGTLFITTKPKSSDTYQQLILISLEDEKIEVGDLAYRLSTKVLKNMSKTANWFSCGWRKVIATSDKTINAPFGGQDIFDFPVISPELIQQLVDEYNNGGMQDFEIEMEEVNPQEYHAEIDYFGKTDIELEYEPKLTNGFVTVVEENNCIKDITNGWGNLSKEQLDTIHPKKSTREQEVSDNKELVDFEKVFNIVDELGYIDDFYPTNIDELGIKNLQLFFQKLSESSTFARKAHKELQRLNK